MNNDGEVHPPPRPSTRAKSSAIPEEKLKEVVRAMVEAQVAKEQAIVKEAIGIAVKIVGASLAILVAIFTIFSITTWDNIESKTLEVVEKKVDTLVSDSKSDTAVKNKIDDLMNRLIVAWQLSRLEKIDPDIMPSEPEYDLDYDDWRRLESWIMKPTLPLEDFANTVSVLNRQTDGRRDEDADKVFAPMLEPLADTSPYSWLVWQSRKIDSILSSFKHPNLGSRALALIGSDSLSDTTRAAAALYVGDVRYYQGVNGLLEDYAKLGAGPIKWNVLISCVNLGIVNPPELMEGTEGPVALPAVQLVLQDFVNQKDTTKEQLEAATTMIRNLAGSTAGKEASKDLISYLLRKNAHFSIDSETVADVYSVRDTIGIPKSQDPPSVNLDMPALKGMSVAYQDSKIDINEFANLSYYWDYLGELANSGNIDGLATILLRNTGVKQFPRGFSYVGIIVTAAAGSIATVDLGGADQDIDINSMARVLVSQGRDPTTKVITLTWTDKNGVRTSGRLVAFKGTGFKLALKDVGLGG